MCNVFYPTKLTECLGKCGEQVQYKTNKRVYCKTCRMEKIRQTSREAMKIVRRAKGATEIDVYCPCIVCNKDYLRKRAHSVRCPTCQAEAALRKSRDSAKLRASTEDGKKYMREWFKKKRKTSPNFSVSCHMRTLIHRALGKGKSGKSWRTFVEYSLEELMAHLERQFLPGMNWENRSKWHIDHIIPRSSFEYASPEDEEFKRAWALSNLRPIWARDNVQKSATRTHLI